MRCISHYPAQRIIKGALSRANKYDTFCTAFPRESETRIGHWNGNQNYDSSSCVSFQVFHLENDIELLSFRLWFAFRWPSEREGLSSLGKELYTCLETSALQHTGTHYIRVSATHGNTLYTCLETSVRVHQFVYMDISTLPRHQNLRWISSWRKRCRRKGCPSSMWPMRSRCWSGLCWWNACRLLDPIACVCVCVCVWVCVCVNISIYMYMCIYLCMYVNKYMYMYTYIHICAVTFAIC